MNQFSDTIFLPKTSFSMRANLSDNEQRWLDYWVEINLYQRIKNKKKKKNLYFMMGRLMLMATFILVML